MPDWRSRLVVRYESESGGDTITPIDSFQPSFSLSAEPVHSIEDTHIGVIFSPDQVNFTITAKALGADGAVARLTHLAMTGRPFEISLEKQEGEDDDWSFDEIILGNCFITNASPTNAAISGAPMATFSGFSLGASARSGNGENASSVGSVVSSSGKIGGVFEPGAEA